MAIFAFLLISLQIYQKLEEERVEFLRNEMWVHTNIISQTCIDEDEVIYYANYLC